MRTKNKQGIKNAAKKNITALFAEAEKIFPDEKELANRYVGLARSISLRHKVRIPKELSRRYCKNCMSYIVPGENCRIRCGKGKTSMTCLMCGNTSRHGYSKEQKIAKKKPISVSNHSG